MYLRFGGPFLKGGGGYFTKSRRACKVSDINIYHYNFYFFQDFYLKVAEDRVIESYFYQIDQDTLPEVRYILILRENFCVVMIRT